MDSSDKEDAFKPDFLSKINARSVTVLSMILMSLIGCLFIFLGIKDDGLIDLKAPFIKGQVKYGFVGVVVLVIASFNLILALRTIPKTPLGRKITIKKSDGTVIELDGVMSMKSTLREVSRLLPETGSKLLPDKSESDENSI